MADREIATMPAVENVPGEGIALVLIRADGSSMAVHLGPAEAIAVAGDLIQAARIRLGRQDWPPQTDLPSRA